MEVQINPNTVTPLDYAQGLIEDEYQTAIAQEDEESASVWADGLKFFREGPGEGGIHKTWAETAIRGLIPIYGSVYGSDESKRPHSDQEEKRRTALLSKAIDEVLGLHI